MEKDRDGFAATESDERKHDSRMSDIQEMLYRVDRALAEFYEIHRPHIKEPADRL